jgi:DNA-binding PadR family transcriptional regulator
MISRPLKPQWFQILLALSAGDLHGYAIQRAVLAQTDGQIRLWPAMLYRSLAKLEEYGVIVSAEPPADEPEDERRQYYSISPEGRALLKQEGEMLARWAAAAGQAGS